MIYDDREDFLRQTLENIDRMNQDEKIPLIVRDFVLATAPYQYTYNLTWLGVPILQGPWDMCGMQEIIWETKPEVIIETGIARGGSLIFYASMLEIMGGSGEVIGIDIDIRPHNRDTIESHPLVKRIHMIEGSSIDPDVIDQVKRRVGDRRAMVILDSNHTHDHVFQEINAYSSFVPIGGYCVVCDTGAELFPEQLNPEKPWGKGNNPMTAVLEFLKTNSDFIIDRKIQRKMLIVNNPDGLLRRIR